jgi:Cu+-exporting ATPase
MFRSSNLICLQGAIISVSLGLRVWFKERKKQRLKDIGLSSFKETKIERTARHIAFFSIYIGIIFAVLVFGIRFYRQGIEASLFCFISIILASSCYSLLKAGRSAFEVGFNRGKTFGITFKEPSTFFRCSACEMVIFQKSGGLTYNTPLVKEFVPIQGSSEELLGILAGVEERLEVDPIAKAIVQFVRESNIEILEPRRIRILSDLGVEAKSHLGNILIGDRKLFLTQGIALGFAEDYAHKFEKQGKTPVFVALNKELRGIFAIEDKIKSEAGIAISKLLKLGIEPLMITGTTQEAAKNIGQRIGIENVRAEIPSSKHAQEIQLLKERGLRIATVQNQNIAMAQPISGDVNFVLEVSPENINRYDISISGTNLDKIPKAFLISKDVKQTIYQNLSFCFTIVLAGSILGALGIAPPWAVAIFSSLCSIITERGLPIYKKISLE